MRFLVSLAVLLLLAVAAPAQPDASGTTWEKVATGGPARRAIAALAFDAAHERTVLFGGDQWGVGVLGETWLWDGTAWTQHAGVEPSPRYGHVMAYDPERRVVVLFGGYDRVQKTLFNDTWIWDGTTWTKLAATGPAPRRSPAFAFHHGRKTLMLWGGLGENPDGSEKFLQDTWEWNGTEWKQLANEGPPPAYGSEMAYDVAAKRLLLFGGNDHSGNVYNHTWRWSKDGWRKLETSGGPAPRGGAQLVYVPRTKRVHLYGGFSPGAGGRGLEVHLDEWTWSGTAWEEVSDPTQPQLLFPKLTYDSVRNRLAYFGQRDFRSTESELWEKEP